MTTALVAHDASSQLPDPVFVEWTWTEHVMETTTRALFRRFFLLRTQSKMSPSRKWSVRNRKYFVSQTRVKKQSFALHSWFGRNPHSTPKILNVHFCTIYGRGVFMFMFTEGGFWGCFFLGIRQTNNWHNTLFARIEPTQQTSCQHLVRFKKRATLGDPLFFLHDVNTHSFLYLHQAFTIVLVPRHISRTRSSISVPLASPSLY